MQNDDERSVPCWRSHGYVMSIHYDNGGDAMKGSDRQCSKFTRFRSIAFLAVSLVVFYPAFSLNAADPLQKNGSITSIEDAGIYCSVEGTGKDFYKFVERDCLGKDSCELTPLVVGTKEELERAGCTGYFVAAVCAPDKFPKNFETQGLGPLLVSCR
jgi:hypothetical protein